MKPATMRFARYGALGALCVVLAGSAFYLFERAAPAAPTQQAAAPKAAAAKTPPVNSNGDDLDVPTITESEAAQRLIGEARRLADDGKFDEAQARLAQADKVAPGLRETADERRKITELSTPQGQFATQLARARAAIEQDDDAAAEKALAEAERLKPQAPEIAPLRQAFEAAQRKEARRHGRVETLLTSMRAAIARGDIAEADAALNAASRIDILDPALDRARTELAHAHDEARKQQSTK